MAAMVKEQIFGRPVVIKGHPRDVYGENLLFDIGGFHLVAEIIREPKSHMIPYKLKCSH